MLPHFNDHNSGASTAVQEVAQSCLRRGEASAAGRGPEAVPWIQCLARNLRPQVGKHTHTHSSGSGQHLDQGSRRCSYLPNTALAWI